MEAGWIWPTGQFANLCSKSSLLQNQSIMFIDGHKKITLANLGLNYNTGERV